MLLKSEILERLYRKEIVITPFTPKAVNPNSIDLHLSPNLKIYSSLAPLDFKGNGDGWEDLVIPSEGYILEPGRFYLGVTAEYTETYNAIPKVLAKSSSSRNSLDVTCSGGFGDIDFNGHWTLALSCKHPVRVYPYMPICQIYYHEALGDLNPENSYKKLGSYNNSEAKAVPFKAKKDLYWQSESFINQFN